jgi:hypothetical protein
MTRATRGPWRTECNVEQLEFHGLGRRAVVGRFDGGTIGSDGGVMLPMAA